MGVMMQAFYWDCPTLEGQENKWWAFLQEKVPGLSAIGFTALWLPPACKAAEANSMGYDPYDYFDLGEFDQKGSVETYFGSRGDLVSLIQTAHQNDMQVYADMVLNHTSGADAEETNEITGQTWWTKYTPASKKFPRNWECYHPSNYERWDEATFGGMPDLCHRNPYVYTQMLYYAKMMVEEIGFDGFRYDFVAGFSPWMVTAIMEYYYRKEDNDGVVNTKYSPFGVGEYWSSDVSISDWLSQMNAFSDAPGSAFDFPLRGRLQNLCMQYGFSLSTLTQPGTLLTDGLSQWAVTFVENHDLDNPGGSSYNPIINDKMLAYSFILTHEGYPCVFWQDYYNWGLAQEGNNSGIAALVKVHESCAGGTTSVLYVDDNLYIMQRNGSVNQPGLLYVLNNNSQWNGTKVATKWNNATLVPVAWWGNGNADTPLPISIGGDGVADAWAPGRGYVVYIAG